MTVRIGDFSLEGRAFIIAEIGGNHDGDFEKAKRLIDAAVEAGADAAKFQVYKADRLVRADMEGMPHVRARFPKQVDRFRSLELAAEQWEELARLCRERGILFSASPFDEESADLVGRLSPFYKIASGDVTHLPLLRHVARSKKPVVMSTGMADEAEIAAALGALAGSPTVLLHCVSRYPTPPAETNLRTVPWLRERFGVPSGYSDHTMGNHMCLGAVALGAVALEKHFTLDRTGPIGDHRFSSEPHEFKALVTAVRELEAGLGRHGKVLGEAELGMRRLMRRSLVAAADLPAGTTVTEAMLDVLRPEDGIPPGAIDRVVGARTVKAVAKGKPLTWDCLEAGR